MVVFPKKSFGDPENPMVLLPKTQFRPFPFDLFHVLTEVYFRGVSPLKFPR